MVLTVLSGITWEDVGQSGMKCSNGKGLRALCGLDVGERIAVFGSDSLARREGRFWGE